MIRLSARLAGKFKSFDAKHQLPGLFCLKYNLKLILKKCNRNFGHF